MEAIVLAGGFGTRLREVVSDVPKPMAPVAGRPFLEILLSSLADKGFERIVLSLGYMSEKVVNHFGHKFSGMEILYAIEEIPLGTGGAIRSALSSATQDHVFVINGDTYIDLEYDELEAMWQEYYLPIIVAREVDDASRYGGLLVEAGFVSGFAEKRVTGPGIINAGCYVLPRLMSPLAGYEAPFSIEADFFGEYVKGGQVRVFISKGKFIDIGIPADYFRAQIELAGAVF